MQNTSKQTAVLEPAETNIQSYTSSKQLLDLGDVLLNATVAYQTFGNTANKQTHCIWVCHALTGNTDPTTWWEALFTEEGAFPLSKYYVVCANIYGSPYGSSSPLSQNPNTQEAYYKTFPSITTRDIATSFEGLRNQLGINKIHTLIGGSLGGQCALEWACTYPNICNYLVPIATNAVHSAWGKAFNTSQRMAIETDQTWQLNSPTAGEQGLAVARSIAMLSYRSAEIYNSKQSDDVNTVNMFKADTYQRYQGQKLTERFNAHAYWFLSKTMDNHNLGRNRVCIKTALSTVKAKALVMSINSDLLFTPKESGFIAQHLPNAQYTELQSRYGHDGFLIETEQINRHLKQFIK